MLATRQPLRLFLPSSPASRPAANCSNIREVARSQTLPGPPYKPRSKTGAFSNDDNRLLSDGTYRYEYDDEGNLTARFVDEDSSGTLNTGDTDITESTWDYRNRLTDVAHRSLFGGSDDWTVEYVYDALNRRIASLVDEDGDSTLDREERYVWEGQNVALDFVDPDGGNGGEQSALSPEPENEELANPKSYAF